MAVIGPMRKLTIGNKTYLIAAGLDSLPIASASTLGGIKVGTGLTIDSTTGVLSATGTDVTIDNAISGTSTNPVQNKVIKEYVDGLVAGVLHYKGTKATTAALPSSGNITGDVWHVTLDGGEYAWDGSTWQELGTITDLSGYMASADYPDLTAIEGISATSGLLKKTAANTWTLDTSNYLTSFTETDPTVPSWAKASTKPSYTASLVGAAASDHVHGNITNGGDITATAPTVASGDKIIINDESASKITNGPSFGTSTTTYLRNDGTWETPEGIPQQGISPIGIDTDTYEIYHEYSGVTAGTYAAAGSKSGGFYIPSFVVDDYGHITSVTSLGTLVPTIGEASAASYGGLITDYSFGSTLRTTSIYNGGGLIASGDTFGTYTINADTYGPYTNSSYWRVADVQAWNANTGKTVIVDWSVSTSGKIVTASIAESYADNIYFVPIITTYAPTM